MYTRTEQVENLRRAATVLEAHQQPEAAISLCSAIDSWSEAIRTLACVSPIGAGFTGKQSTLEFAPARNQIAGQWALLKE